MLNGDELGPRNLKALWFISIILLLGAIINANMFGELAILVTAMNRKAAYFQNKLDTANNAMLNLKLSENL